MILVTIPEKCLSYLYLTRVIPAGLQWDTRDEGTVLVGLSLIPGLGTNRSPRGVWALVRSKN